MGRVYQAHGYSMRNQHLIPGANPPSKKVTRRLKQEFDPSHHVPSEVHRNISYGASTKPKMRARLDRKIDPTISEKLKHPVVFHHDKKLHPNVMGAAVPAHSTTGGRGHVVLGSTFKGSGKRKGNEAISREDVKSSRATINHELIHAGAKKTPWQPGMKRMGVRAMGEEARADAASGANLYTKTGVISPRKTIKQAKGEIRAAKSSGQYPKETIRQAKQTVAPHVRYHEVKRAVAATRQPSTKAAPAPAAAPVAAPTAAPVPVKSPARGNVFTRLLRGARGIR
jgi:hypothetical protein